MKRSLKKIAGLWEAYRRTNLMKDIGRRLPVFLAEYQRQQGDAKNVPPFNRSATPCIFLLSISVNRATLKKRSALSSFCARQLYDPI